MEQSIGRRLFDAKGQVILVTFVCVKLELVNLHIICY